MKVHLYTLFVLAGAACILCGCGDSKPATSGESAGGIASPAAEVAPRAEATKAVEQVAKAAVKDLTSQFAKLASSQADKALGSVGNDLVDKVKALGETLGANAAVKSQLDTTLQSLIAGQDAEALGTVYQVVQAANLTPQQLQLAKEVGNLASAFVVQRNFAALEGAQGDVATIVNSLRKGEITAAIPAIQNVAQNANLTASQKQLISSLADKYAPGLKQATDSLQRGLQGIQNLPGATK